MTAQHRFADARRQDCLHHLFCFQRDEPAAPLAVNAHQNFLVRLQLLTDRKQIFRVLTGCLLTSRVRQRGGNEHHGGFLLHKQLACREESDAQSLPSLFRFGKPMGMSALRSCRNGALVEPSNRMQL
jgi:hypothetical protein